MAMFSLDSSMCYWLYNKPVSMRLGFNGLSGIITNCMGMNIKCGDVFIFVNATRNRIKVLHREEGGLVLYALRIDVGRIRLPLSCDIEELASTISHSDLISMAKSAMESPYVRRLKILSKCI